MLFYASEAERRLGWFFAPSAYPAMLGGLGAHNGMRPSSFSMPAFWHLSDPAART